jgi:hypothetical protein
MREPLLHFVLIGGLLFAVDQFIVGRTDDPHTIVVTSAIDREASQIFRAERGREPNRAELEALRRVWLDNEVLYREGLALGVDKGDSAIRDRVIFKALSVVDANVKLPAIDDAGLRQWFDAHRAKYDEPQRFNFKEAVLTGDNSESAVRGFVAALKSGAPGDTEAGLRVFKDRPFDNLVESYGAPFAQELEKAPLGEWVALESKKGWRAVLLGSVVASKPGDYESLRGVVQQDWTDATASEQRTAAVRQLARKYKIRFEDAAS